MIKRTAGFLKKRFLLNKKETTKLEQSRFVDLSVEDWEIIQYVRPYTMTSIERIKTLIDSVQYISKNNLEGDFVECGVWKGGSVMAMVLTLKRLKAQFPKIWLYDTFEGMSEPTNEDVDYNDRQASEQLESSDKESSPIWCFSQIDEVKENLEKVGYPETKLRLIQGRAEETLYGEIPDTISLLRLDTDWYQSTKVELEVLLPRVVPGGIIIIDDYGHWKGSKKAVDEFMEKEQWYPYMHRIDYTGRLIIK